MLIFLTLGYNLKFCKQWKCISKLRNLKKHNEKIVNITSCCWGFEVVLRSPRPKFQNHLVFITFHNRLFVVLKTLFVKKWVFFVNLYLCKSNYIFRQTSLGFKRLCSKSEFTLFLNKRWKWSNWIVIDWNFPQECQQPCLPNWGAHSIWKLWPDTLEYLWPNNAFYQWNSNT